MLQLGGQDQSCWKDYTRHLHTHGLLFEEVLLRCVSVSENMNKRNVTANACSRFYYCTLSITQVFIRSDCACGTWHSAKFILCKTSMTHTHDTSFIFSVTGNKAEFLQLKTSCTPGEKQWFRSEHRFCTMFLSQLWKVFLCFCFKTSQQVEVQLNLSGLLVKTHKVQVKTQTKFRLSLHPASSAYMYPCSHWKFSVQLSYCKFSTPTANLHYSKTISHTTLPMAAGSELGQWRLNTDMYM